MSEEVATAYGDMRELTRLRTALEAAQAELAAARKIVTWARLSARYAKRGAKGTIDADIAAYDEAVKAGMP